MNNKKVKIVATTGPAVDSEEKVLRLAEEGVNVFRINLSHATMEEVQSRTNWVRAAEKKLGRSLTVMGDLAGPKIRIGDVAEGIELKEGDTIEVVAQEVLGDNKRISLNYPSIVKQLKPGAEIYIDDGKIKLDVEKETKAGVMARITAGGKLKPKKGFYGQGISLATKGLSKKDQDSIDMMVKVKADAIAISFVQTEKDVELVRKQLPANAKMMLVAKIETVKGLENIEAIIDAADAIMVARGDLGLAVPMEEIPHLQKQLVELCLRHAKPVITATQMLESMIENPLPTRAEVTDVANAIMYGTDAVMLSAETASGNFPHEAVRMMSRVIKRAVPHVPVMEYYEPSALQDAISAHVGKIADQLQAKLIIAFTESGVTARRMSRHRHQQAIIALSPNLHTVRSLNFSYNVYAMQIEKTKDFDHMVETAKKIAKSNKIVPLEKGEPFVIVAGMPYGKVGTTNMIFVERV